MPSDCGGLEVTLMRGGTSRGPAMLLHDAPPAGAERDALACRVVGTSPVDGLGGGTPVTNKVLLVGKGTTDRAQLDYTVGNVAPSGLTVDWAGTCGNMTAAVVPFAAHRGLIEAVAGRGTPSSWTLRNLSTDSVVEIETTDTGALFRPGDDVQLRTTYRDPGGSVLGRALPTGRVCDDVQLAGLSIPVSVIDVTHPYLFLRRRDLDRVPGDAAAVVEQIRGRACVALGLAETPESAAQVSPSVPRAVVLEEDPPPDGADIAVTAVSLGAIISTVPVTAALALAVSAQHEGSIVQQHLTRAAAGDGLRVAASGASLYARAVLAADRSVTSASVERTSRVLLSGTYWL